MPQYTLVTDQEIAEAIKKQIGHKEFKKLFSVQLIDYKPQPDYVEVIVSTEKPEFLFSLGRMVGIRMMAQKAENMAKNP
ncbi:hypothetical protein HUW51_17025 [Adhaeribacter swui]|uniref:Uncharacterized protein n=1 Tax=Adhaeribacter swui TaxID=2086471 RepID=A0A7G7GB07_9BACT|nr:hypothetical protein [Adhaeribacter swui]QNF34341.1 hypothetical protein HUW51_17025 [Adhaeribacter swui]